MKYNKRDQNDSCYTISNAYDISEYISEGYCVSSKISNLRSYFIKNNTIFLGDLLVYSSLNSFSSILSLKSTCWKKQSIPDRYSYSVFSKLDICQKNIDYQRILFAIISFARSLSSPDNQECSIDILKFSHEDYTLLHDYEMFCGVMGFFFLDDFNSNFGGDIVITSEGNTLYRITPVQNMLVLLKIDTKTNIFIKYLNVDSSKRSFRVIRFKF